MSNETIRFPQARFLKTIFNNSASKPKETSLQHCEYSGWDTVRGAGEKSSQQNNHLPAAAGAVLEVREC